MQLSLNWHLRLIEYVGKILASRLSYFVILAGNFFVRTLPYVSRKWFEKDIDKPIID